MIICRELLLSPRSSLLRSKPVLCPSWSTCSRATCRHIVALAQKTDNQAVLSQKEPVLETIETLPSGSQVKKLEGYKEPRTSEDLPPELVDRLVKENISMKPPVKMGIRGVTKQVGEDIRKRWNKRDVVKVWAEHKKVKGDMKETAAQLERFTGGLVIWRSGAKLLIYKDPEGQKNWVPPWQQVSTCNDDSGDDSDYEDDWDLK